ncbi:MAG: tyrosine-type recombinase/integrase [Planctomycetes bacterium]|nr:tyrosine-type recombinase/integrase [Planctomycetota bacterium]
MATEPPGETLPFAAAITVWLTSMADLSPRTLALYRESAEHFATWCTGRGIAGVNFLTPADLVAYRGEWQAALDAGDYKRSTVGNKLVAIRRFLLHCRTEDFLPAGMTRGRIETYLKSPRQTKGKTPDILDAEEIAGLLGVITDERDKALFTLAIGAGLRVSELVGLKVGNLRPQRGGWAILEVHGKGDKVRTFRIPPEVMRPLRGYLETTGRTFRRAADLETWLFPGSNGSGLHRTRINQLLAGYVKAAGIQKPISPHTLRHTFATHYLATGGNVVALAEVLGHANLDTVMVYAHMAKLITEEGYRAGWLGAS